nr:hypothetical protein [Micromonospora sp. DSM 115978]
MAVVEIITGTRVHLTLIDMNGTSSGRVDGGVGLMLTEPRIRLTVTAANRSQVRWTGAGERDPGDELLDAALSALRDVRHEYAVGGRLIEIHECPGFHLGLGTKTQLRLAVGLAALQAGTEPGTFDLEDPSKIEKLSAVLGRGGTSGIGTHGFALGGFVVDGGHATDRKGVARPYRPSSASAGSGVAPLLARHRFPDWPLLLVVPHGRRIHGSEEERLFREVCPVPLDDVRSLSHVVLMRMLPALVEEDLPAFGASLWAVQRHRWKSFETAAQAPAIGRLVDRFESDLGLAGVCMSSWGSALLCVDERFAGAGAESIRRRIRQLVEVEAGGGVVIPTSARNTGASLSAVK